MAVPTRINTTAGGRWNRPTEKKAGADVAAAVRTATFTSPQFNIEDAIEIDAQLTITAMTGQTYEVDSVTITGAPTGGSVTLAFSWNGNTYTTAAIVFNATAAQVQAAVLAATRTGGIAFSADAGANAVVCTGGPLPGSAVTVTFQNNATGAVTAQATTNSLTGGTTPAVTFTRTTPGTAMTAALQLQCSQDAVTWVTRPEAPPAIGVLGSSQNVTFASPGVYGRWVVTIAGAATNISPSIDHQAVISAL